ncbi:ABC transporter permease [Micromonospora coerulea]|uniref:ABC transporter permease n=1 Tax=Micromonospora coerulea TaxID=47856 RepID=UPI00190734C3|nr:ABC transporter permease [Micromonospora veneta]
MLLFCGINLSTAETPAATRVVGDFMPLTHGLRAVRDVLAGRSVATGDWLRELAIGVACTVIACVLLQVFARQARADASLDISA